MLLYRNNIKIHNFLPENYSKNKSKTSNPHKNKKGFGEERGRHILYKQIKK